MSFYVVDANVPIVSNGKSDQADPECVLACLSALQEIRDTGIMVLDDAMIILDQYRKKLSLSGQPGPGDSFMKWIWDVQADERYCRRVHLTPLEGDLENFAEYPQDDRLRNFDRDDRVFVAVALKSGSNPDILNAVDSDWAEHFTALCEVGVRIRFLCPQHVRPGR